MPTCPNCHADVASGSRFCPGCGSPISSSAHCPSCGAEVASGAAFCTKCGTRIAGAPQLSAQPAYQPATPRVAPAAAPGIALGKGIPAVPPQPQQPMYPSAPVAQPSFGNSSSPTPIEGNQVTGARKGLGVVIPFNIICMVLTIIGGLFLFYCFISLAFPTSLPYWNYVDPFEFEIFEADYESLYKGQIFGAMVLTTLFIVPFMIGMIITGKVKGRLRRIIANNCQEN